MWMLKSCCEYIKMEELIKESRGKVVTRRVRFSNKLSTSLPPTADQYIFLSAN